MRLAAFFAINETVSIEKNGVSLSADVRVLQFTRYLLEIVIATGEEEALGGVAAPPQEGGQARQRRVHPQAHQDYEGLHNN
jgi:hypothetical protein